MSELSEDVHGDPIPPIRLREIIIELGPPSVAVKPPELSLALTDNIELVDAEYAEDTTILCFPTKEDFGNFYGTMPGVGGVGEAGTGDQYGMGESGAYDGIPSPDIFVIVEVLPVPVYEEPVLYPKLAEEGGFSATVTVQAFVSKEGRVIRAEAIKSTRPNIGFEEAAIRSALKSIFRPAIQNGHPIGVWIVYRINFVIER